MVSVECLHYYEDFPREKGEHSSSRVWVGISACASLALQEREFVVCACVRLPEAEPDARKSSFILISKMTFSRVFVMLPMNPPATITHKSRGGLECSNRLDGED